MMESRGSVTAPCGGLAERRRWSNLVELILEERLKGTVAVFAFFQVCFLEDALET
jgi:hypothetical protein